MKFFDRFKQKLSARKEDSPKAEEPLKEETQDVEEIGNAGEASTEKTPRKPRHPAVEDFLGRLSRVKKTRWIRFGIVSLIFFLFVIWVGNPWLLLFWLLLVDIYITSYVPWGWWKKKKGPVRTVMAWVDAIVYALILVYFIFAFIGQNYKIPSSSLEKSLLVGDFLWVNKVTYGPRVPNTPLHFPLAQHTMPIFGGKSYIENPQFSYHRLPGLRWVERGDIVVFNYPEGDTVFSRMPDLSYYGQLDSLRRHGIEDAAAFFQDNRAFYGDLIWRPVDRRENYVKRAIGLPGERIQIKDDVIYIDGSPIGNPDNVQFNYIVPVRGTISDEKWLEIGVRREDHGAAPLSFTMPGDDEQQTVKYYDVPLTAEMKSIVEKWPEVTGPLQKSNVVGDKFTGNVWPHGNTWDWTRSNTDEFWIPKRGGTLEVTLNNLPLYRRAIETYEGNTVEVKNGRIYINGEDNPYYTFKYDYFWMMGDNRDRSLDSRYFGFVPEDHVVGTPMRILVSIDGERELLDINKIRWDRILANPNPDKEKAAEKNWK